MYVDNFLALLRNGEALPALETIKHLEILGVILYNETKVLIQIHMVIGDGFCFDFSCPIFWYFPPKGTLFIASNYSSC